MIETETAETPDEHPALTALEDVRYLIKEYEGKLPKEALETIGLIVFDKKLSVRVREWEEKWL